MKEEKVFRIFTDTVSGSSTQRPGLDGALNYLRAGDQLIVVSMDRLARSLVDLHRLVDELTERSVSVKFLKEGADLLVGFNADCQAYARTAWQCGRV